MRFMIFVKAAEDGPPPPPAFLEVMGRASQAAIAAGTLLDTGGLAPTARSTRVRLSNSKVTVTDGPFTEVKEVVGGYGVVQASSREEALAGVMNLIELHREHWPGWEGEIDVRQILGPEDFAPQAQAGASPA